MIPLLLSLMNAMIVDFNADAVVSFSSFSNACDTFRLLLYRMRYTSMISLIDSDEKPLLLNPTELIPEKQVGMFPALTKGGTSFLTVVKPPIYA